MNFGIFDVNLPASSFTSIENIMESIYKLEDSENSVEEGEFEQLMISKALDFFQATKSEEDVNGKSGVKDLKRVKGN